MALTDMGLEEARRFRPQVPEPPGLDAFWAATLDEHEGVDLDVHLEPFDNRQRVVDTYDLSFTGYGGARISAWLHLPAGETSRRPLVVQYVGYSGSRGVPLVTPFAAAGWAHVIMEPRGQGWAHPALSENCPDPDPVGGSGAPGHLTSSLTDPRGHYYRRLCTDAYRCLQAARGLAGVDPSRVVVVGHSQGGAQAIAVAGLCGMRGVGLSGAFVDAPFLCHIRRAVDVATAGPYLEVVSYLRAHPNLVGRAFETLAHFDGIHLARRARCPAHFSVAMMDPVCPPSTVWAAYNLWGAPPGVERDMAVYPFAEHACGEDLQTWNQLAIMERAFATGVRG